VVDQDQAALTVVRRSGLSPAQKVRLALDDNRSAEFSTFDPTILDELKNEGVEVGLLWNPVEWHQATTAEEAYEPAPVATRSTTKTPEASVRIGLIRVPLTEEAEALLVAFIKAWAHRYGSSAGAGLAFLQAARAVISLDPKVQAISG
jgi:hypothetical protein